MCFVVQVYNLESELTLMRNVTATTDSIFERDDYYKTDYISDITRQDSPPTQGQFGSVNFYLLFFIVWSWDGCSAPELGGGVLIKKLIFIAILCIISTNVAPQVESGPT